MTKGCAALPVCQYTFARPGKALYDHTGIGPLGAAKVCSELAQTSSLQANSLGGISFVDPQAPGSVLVEREKHQCAGAALAYLLARFETPERSAVWTTTAVTLTTLAAMRTAENVEGISVLSRNASLHTDRHACICTYFPCWLDPTTILYSLNGDYSDPPDTKIENIMTASSSTIEICASLPGDTIMMYSDPGEREARANSTTSKNGPNIPK